MSARKIHDEAEARECIAKMKESGLTLAQWARSAGIDGRSLHAWNVNLARGGCGLRRAEPGARWRHYVHRDNRWLGSISASFWTCTRNLLWAGPCRIAL